jgi:hypothetical protein
VGDGVGEKILLTHLIIVLESAMAVDRVNIDALIPREDFLASEGADAGASGKASASRTDLLKGESFYLTLRKPDFQRETAA